MTPILQSHLPHCPWMDPRTARLPGVLPIEGDDWLRVDDAFAGQMAERDRLLSEVPHIVHALLDAGRPAAVELYDLILTQLPAEYRLGATSARRPDGVEVPLDRDRPLLTLGRLVQEDLCLMERHGDEHRLTGATLCFPASWSLAEKIGRPLTGMHTPVPSYDADIARRVQRMFDAVRVEQPLWRMNALVYVDPALHQPRRETDPRTERRGGGYVRSERQCFVRLPQTRVVVFSIHTYVVRIETLSEEARAGLEEAQL